MNDTTRREIERGWLGRSWMDPQGLPEADYEGDDPVIEAGRPEPQVEWKEAA